MTQRACEGQTAIVTGASRGIGAAIARRLASEGAAVAVIARTLDAHPTLPGSLAETVATIEAAGGRAAAVPVNLADPTDRATVVSQVEASLGPADILVNNAAAAFYAPVGAFPPSRSRLLFEVNVLAPLDLAQQVLGAMRARRRGWILNISSSASGHPGDQSTDADNGFGTTTTVYGACKAALERLTTGLALEVGSEGIAVNVLAPSAAVHTPAAEVFMPELLANRPDLVEPIEVMAEAALALCTCDPDVLTGRIVSSRALLHELSRQPAPLDGTRSAHEPDRVR